jgi:hypothetical protein
VNLLLAAITSLAFASSTEQALTAQPWCARVTLCDTVRALGQECDFGAEGDKPVALYKITFSKSGAEKAFTYTVLDLATNRETTRMGGIWFLRGAKLELRFLMLPPHLKLTPEEMADEELMKMLRESAFQVKGELKGARLFTYNPDNNYPIQYTKCE